jgi:hypothetical protein
VLVSYNDSVEVSQSSIVGEPTTDKDLRRRTLRGLQECQKNVLWADIRVPSQLGLTAGLLDQASFAISKWEHHVLSTWPTSLAQGDLKVVANTVQRNARMLEHRDCGVLAFAQEAESRMNWRQVCIAASRCDSPSQCQSHAQACRVWERLGCTHMILIVRLLILIVRLRLELTCKDCLVFASEASIRNEALSGATLVTPPARRRLA